MTRRTFTQGRASKIIVASKVQPSAKYLASLRHDNKLKADTTGKVIGIGRTGACIVQWPHLKTPVSLHPSFLTIQQ